MLIFGFYVGAPVLLVTLLAGLTLLRDLLAESRINSAILSAPPPRHRRS